MAEQEHKHGEMNTEVQEQTFAGFVRWMMWAAGGVIAILIFLAIFNS
ncbi:aa3 type cytochrome c oxidase subunit IV [Salinihabitans flavidus]|uniref:Aa3 type cytochrome c oxidase subunit IV n=1 Tax=Salinihabitans flavidus TaxID=569882 RepID=A0A1H8SXU9_9RHOB|nr:aa3-type cytochrome c oxidase subunit IV [Salinihabitans flavidus]SEO83296.1 aa3 type cytochrome c oxidase subunit IV [Salinihabitans flavidus]